MDATYKTILQRNGNDLCNAYGELYELLQTKLLTKEYSFLNEFVPYLFHKVLEYNPVGYYWIQDAKTVYQLELLIISYCTKAMFHNTINIDYVSVLKLATSFEPLLHQRLWDGITYTSEIIKHSIIEMKIHKKASNSTKIFAQAVYACVTDNLDSIKAAILNEMQKLGIDKETDYGVPAKKDGKNSKEPTANEQNEKEATKPDEGSNPTTEAERVAASTSPTSVCSSEDKETHRAQLQSALDGKPSAAFMALIELLVLVMQYTENANPENKVITKEEAMERMLRVLSVLSLSHLVQLPSSTIDAVFTMGAVTARQLGGLFRLAMRFLESKTLEQRMRGATLLSSLCGSKYDQFYDDLVQLIIETGLHTRIFTLASHAQVLVRAKEALAFMVTFGLVSTDDVVAQLVTLAQTDGVQLSSSIAVQLAATASAEFVENITSTFIAQFGIANALTIAESAPASNRSTKLLEQLYCSCVAIDDDNNTVAATTTATTTTATVGERIGRLYAACQDEAAKEQFATRTFDSIEHGQHVLIGLSFLLGAWEFVKRQRAKCNELVCKTILETLKNSSALQKVPTTIKHPEHHQLAQTSLKEETGNDSDAELTRKRREHAHDCISKAFLLLEKIEMDGNKEVDCSEHLRAFIADVSPLLERNDSGDSAAEVSDAIVTLLCKGADVSSALEQVGKLPIRLLSVGAVRSVLELLADKWTEVTKCRKAEYSYYNYTTVYQIITCEPFNEPLLWRIITETTSEQVVALVCDFLKARINEVKKSTRKEVECILISHALKALELGGANDKGGVLPLLDCLVKEATKSTTAAPAGRVVQQVTVNFFVKMPEYSAYLTESQERENTAKMELVSSFETAFGSQRKGFVVFATARLETLFERLRRQLGRDDFEFVNGWYRVSGERPCHTVDFDIELAVKRETWSYYQDTWTETSAATSSTVSVYDTLNVRAVLLRVVESGGKHAATAWNVLLSLPVSNHVTFAELCKANADDTSLPCRALLLLRLLTRKYKISGWENTTEITIPQTATNEKTIAIATTATTTTSIITTEISPPITSINNNNNDDNSCESDIDSSTEISGDTDEDSDDTVDDNDIQETQEEESPVAETVQLAVHVLQQCRRDGAQWEELTQQALVGAVLCVEHYRAQLESGEQQELRKSVAQTLSDALLLICDAECTFLRHTFAKQALSIVKALGLPLPTEVLKRMLLDSPSAELRALCAQSLSRDAPTTTALLSLLPTACTYGARASEFFSLLGGVAACLERDGCSGNLGAALSALLSLADETAMTGAARLCTALCATASDADVRREAVRCTDTLLAALFDLTALDTPRPFPLAAAAPRVRLSAARRALCRLLLALSSSGSAADATAITTADTTAHLAKRVAAYGLPAVEAMAAARLGGAGGEPLCAVPADDLAEARKTSPFCGLRNLGCTCYANSVLQQLFHTPSVREGLLRTRTDKESLVLLQRLFCAMEYGTAPACSPRAFLQSLVIAGERVRFGVQMDAEEFLSHVVDLVGATAGREVQGKMCQQIVSMGCKHVSEREEDFVALSVDVLNKRNLQESFEAFLKGDVLDRDNQYHCSVCNKNVDAVKQQRVSVLPHTLVVHLKRFEFNFETFEREKVNGRFEFPMQLDCKVLLKDGADEAQLQRGTRYRLAGVVIHSGTAQSGHYYSYIDCGDGWYEFNDSSVSAVDPKCFDDLCYGGKAFGKHWNEATESFIEGEYDKHYSAYILFYRREQPDDSSAQLPTEKKTNLPPLTENVKNSCIDIQQQQQQQQHIDNDIKNDIILPEHKTNAEVRPITTNVECPIEVERPCNPCCETPSTERTQDDTTVAVHLQGTFMQHNTTVENNNGTYSAHVDGEKHAASATVHDDAMECDENEGGELYRASLVKSVTTEQKRCIERAVFASSETCDFLADITQALQRCSSAGAAVATAALTEEWFPFILRYCTVVKPTNVERWVSVLKDVLNTHAVSLCPKVLSLFEAAPADLLGTPDKASSRLPKALFIKAVRCGARTLLAAQGEDSAKQQGLSEGASEQSTVASQLETVLGKVFSSAVQTHDAALFELLGALLGECEDGRDGGEGAAVASWAFSHGWTAALLADLRSAVKGATPLPAHFSSEARALLAVTAAVLSRQPCESKTQASGLTGDLFKESGSVLTDTPLFAAICGAKGFTAHDAKTLACIARRVFASNALKEAGSPPQSAGCNDGVCSFTTFVSETLGVATCTLMPVFVDVLDEVLSVNDDCAAARRELVPPMLVNALNKEAADEDTCAAVIRGFAKLAAKYDTFRAAYIAHYELFSTLAGAANSGVASAAAELFRTLVPIAMSAAPPDAAEPLCAVSDDVLCTSAVLKETLWAAGGSFTNTQYRELVYYHRLTKDTALYPERAEKLRRSLQRLPEEKAWCCSLLALFLKDGGTKSACLDICTAAAESLFAIHVDTNYYGEPSEACKASIRTFLHEVLSMVRAAPSLAVLFVESAGFAKLMESLAWSMGMLPPSFTSNLIEIIQLAANQLLSSVQNESQIAAAAATTTTTTTTTTSSSSSSIQNIPLLSENATTVRSSNNQTESVTKESIQPRNDALHSDTQTEVPHLDGHSNENASKDNNEKSSESSTEIAREDRIKDYVEQRERTAGGDENASTVGVRKHLVRLYSAVYDHVKQSVSLYWCTPSPEFFLSVNDIVLEKERVAPVPRKVEHVLLALLEKMNDSITYKTAADTVADVYRRVVQQLISPARAESVEAIAAAVHRKMLGAVAGIPGVEHRQRFVFSLIDNQIEHFANHPNADNASLLALIAKALPTVFKGEFRGYHRAVLYCFDAGFPESVKQSVFELARQHKIDEDVSKLFNFAATNKFVTKSNVGCFLELGKIGTNFDISVEKLLNGGGMLDDSDTIALRLIAFSGIGTVHRQLLSNVDAVSAILRDVSDPWVRYKLNALLTPDTPSQQTNN